MSPLRQPGATERTNEWKDWASSTAVFCLIKDSDIIKSGAEKESERMGKKKKTRDMIRNQIWELGEELNRIQGSLVDP